MLQLEYCRTLNDAESVPEDPLENDEEHLTCLGGVAAFYNAPKITFLINTVCSLLYLYCLLISIIVLVRHYIYSVHRAVPVGFVALRYQCISNTQKI